MFRVILQLIIVSLLPIVDWTMCQEIVGGKDQRLRREAGSWFSAMEANCQALKCGDVFVRIRTNFDSTKDGKNGVRGGTIVSDEQFRLRFDLERNRFLFVKTLEEVKIDFELNNTDPDRAVRESRGYDGFVYKNREGVFCSSVNPARKIKVDNIEEALYRHKVPDLRDVGFVTFRSGLDANFVQKLRARLSSPESVERIRSHGDSVVVTMLEKVPQDPNFSIKTEYTFDKSMLVATKIRTSGIEKKPKYREGKISSESISWKEFNGLVLPVKIRETVPKRRKILSEKQSADEHRDIDMHWLSVNEIFSDDDFDARIIRDYGKLKGFLGRGRASAESNQAESKSNYQSKETKEQ